MSDIDVCAVTQECVAERCHIDGCRERADEVRAFLQATTEGFQYAAAHPEEAADLFYDLATAESAALPLPTPLERDMVRASQAVLSKVRGSLIYV